MFEKRVIIGKKYCVITTGQTRITASINNAEVILLNVSDYNKYFFIAPTSKIYSSIDPSCIFDANDLIPFNKNKNLAYLPNLTAALKILLSDIKFKINFKNNKLILHTDRISDDKSQTIKTLLDQVVPQNVKVVHTNYFLPDGYKELEYLEKEKQCVLNVPYTSEESLYVRLKYMTYVNHGGQVIMSGTSTTKDKLASIQEGFSSLNVRINNIANNFALDASQPCEHTYWPHRNLVKIGNTISELTNKLTGVLPGGIMTFFGDYTDRYALKGRVYNVEIGNDSGKVKNLIPCVDNVGAPCFFDIIEYQTYYHSGHLDFIIPGQEYTIQTLDLDLEAKSYAQLTEYGVHRLYKVPEGCNMTKDEYAAANGFKELVEPPAPLDGYWEPLWHETEDKIILEWIETEVPEQLIL